MATTKNIIMKQFNGTDYDTLYPKTVAAQIDDVYSKDETYPKSQLYTQSQLYTRQQILSDATKALYGLNSAAIPNDVLSWIGNYNKYWWRRCDYTASSIVFNTATSDYDFGRAGQSRTTYFYNVSIDYYGNITFSPSGETYRYVPGNTVPTIDKFAGKYFSDYSNATKYTQLYYGGSGITIDVSLDNAQYVRDALTIDMGIPAIPSGSWTYLNSTNQNAYPTGFSGNYYYENIGQPLSNMPKYGKVAFGTYTGNGTVGKDNPNTLSFDFAPKILMIGPIDGGVNFDATSLSAYYHNSGIWFEGVNYIYLSTTSSSRFYTYECFFRVVGNTIIWYSDSSEAPDTQMNESGTTYAYIAIG